MTFRKIFNGRALYVTAEMIWVAKGLVFYGIDYTGKRITPKYSVGNSIEKIVGAFRLSRQLLRIGIHHILPLADGNILVTLKKRTLIVNRKGDVKNTFSGYNGNKPGHRGICITPTGSIFFGEYTLNMNRENNTRLFRSTDNGESFHCILTFPKEEVRHIHFVQWDQYDHCLWLGTGDEDRECKLMRSADDGDTWNLVGEGSQLWRAVGISCTQGSIYWGTDAGSVPDPNFIIKMDRTNCQIEKVLEVEGPCHGNAVMENGTVLVSTGIEGGKNEKDKLAHMRKIQNGSIEEIINMKKDRYPLILQYGVMRFPSGLEFTNKMVFTSYGLKQYGESVLVEDDK